MNDLDWPFYVQLWFHLTVNMLPRDSRVTVWFLQIHWNFQVMGRSPLNDSALVENNDARYLRSLYYFGNF